MTHNKKCRYYDEFEIESDSGAMGIIEPHYTYHKSQRCQNVHFVGQLTVNCNDCQYFQAIIAENDLLERIKTAKFHRDIYKILCEEFARRKYPSTAFGAHQFQIELIDEVPDINDLVSSESDRKNGRGIREIIMDELRIPGSDQQNR